MLDVLVLENKRNVNRKPKYSVNIENASIKIEPVDDFTETVMEFYNFRANNFI